MAISAVRPAPRASSRFARLTHAMSSTQPTAASRISSGRRVSPTSASSWRLTRTPVAALLTGKSRCSAALMTSRSACAEAIVASGRSRPITLRRCAPRSVVIGVSSALSTRASSARVIQMSAAGALIGNWKPAGITPTMVNGRELSTTGRPTMSGAAAKRERHNPSLITATSPPRSSSARKPRPSAGGVPSVENSSDETTAPSTLQRTSAVDEGEAGVAIRRQVLERLQPRTPVEEIGVRRRHRRALARAASQVDARDRDQRVRRRERQRAQEHGVDDAEHRACSRRCRARASPPRRR